MGDETITNMPWYGIKNHLKRGYGDVNKVIRGQATPDQYAEIGPNQRVGYTNQISGIDVNNTRHLQNMGLDAEATRQAVRTGGFVPFTNAEQLAQDRAMAMAKGGPDQALLTAQQQLLNNRGIGMLGSNAGINRLARTNPAQGYLDEGASGQFLSHETNPYLARAVKAAQDPVIERFQAEVLPSVTGQFGAAGRFGSGAHQYAVERATDDLTKNLSDAATNAYLQNYGQERQNMLASQNALGQLSLGQNQALGQLTLGQGQALAEANQRNAAIMPSVSGAIRGQEMEGLRLLEGVGGAQADKARELGSMGANPYDFRAMDERNRIHEYMGLLAETPQFSAQTTSGGGQGTNRTASALGGAATGAATGATIGSAIPGVGTAIGGIAGGLIGGVGGYFL